MATLVTGMGLTGPYVARALVDEWHERPVLYGRVRDPAQIAEVRDHAAIVHGDILDLPELILAAKDHDVVDGEDDGEDEHHPRQRH